MTSTKTASNLRRTFAYGPLSVDQIESRNRSAGQHFFDAAALRFFASRILSETYGHSVFITSERDTYSDNPRRYTVRIGMTEGEVGALGEFQEHKTAAAARKVAAQFGALLDTAAAVETFERLTEEAPYDETQTTEQLLKFATLANALTK